MYQEAVVL